MPIHLDPLSRRRFLRGAAVFSLAPTAIDLSAQEKSTETWALLSDTHIAEDANLQSRQGVNMAEHLRKVVTEVMAERASLTGVIIDGDCAYNDGQPGDYATFAKILEPLEKAGLPIHFTLGNHDNRDTFFQAYEDRAGSSPVATKHCSVIETPLADWILLDTLRFVNKVEGEVGQQQLDWLAARLSESTTKPAIIVGHHYPQVFRTDVIPSEDEIKISGLIDSEPFLKILESKPVAKAYLYGHSHTWNVKSDKTGLHHINLPPTAYVFNPERPSGWVRATVSEEGMTLELRAIDPTHGQHGKQTKIAWR